MTFKERYFQLIEYRQKNSIDKNVYSEVHHIVPKSICPLLSKQKSNLVRLSGKEHFMAHYYLWKWFDVELNDINWTRKMLAAIIKMSRTYKNVIETLSEDEILKLSELYNESRIRQSEILKNIYSSIDKKKEVSNIQKQHYKNHPERRKKHAKFMQEYWSNSKRNPSKEMKEYCRLHPEKQQKQSISMKKHYESKEARELTAQKSKEYYSDEKHKKEAKEYMRCRFTSVDQYTLDDIFIKRFDCVQDAANEIGVKAPNIFACIYNKAKTSAGYKWKKVEK